MKKSVLALIAAVALALTAGVADAQRGGGGGGGGGRGGGGWSGGGGHGGGGWSGGGGGWHGGGSGWHGGGSGWHGGGSGWHGGGWRGGWHGGGWRGGCWGCGWWWGGAAVIATSPWWGWPYWWNAPYWGATYPVATTYTTYDPIVYVEQSQGVQSPPANAPSVPSGSPVTWFYCTSPAGYYPYVQSCSKPWMRVVPDATQPPPSMQPRLAPQG